jgi:putative N6-adenine-specific DNA methylase
MVIVIKVKAANVRKILVQLFILLRVQLYIMNENTDKFRMIAKTISGLEEVLAIELTEMGADDISIVNRGAQFYGDKTTLYRANYLLRTALRVIKPIAVFQASDEEQLYNEVYKIDWSQYLDVNGTFSVDGVTSYSNITHSKYLALKTKDAIVDQFRDKFGKRPNVKLDNSDLVVNVRIFRDECTVSIDSSGESLHKRGYRVEAGLAPLSEVLAAGLVLLSEWDRKSAFIDPMCGSGTIPIEAALIACNIPPGFFREDYCFMHWQDFDNSLWENVKKEADNKIVEHRGDIIGSDRSGRILAIAKKNVRSAGLNNIITLKPSFLGDLIPPESGGIAMMNPPYDERLKTEDVVGLYKSIGDALKQHFQGYQAWVISGHKEALKFVGLRPSRNITVYNGPLECKFAKFDIYEGSKKDLYDKSAPSQSHPNERDINHNVKRKRIRK